MGLSLVAVHHQTPQVDGMGFPDVLPLVFIAAVVGVIVYALFFEGKRRQRVTPPEPPVTLGPLHEAINRLHDLPAEGANRVEVAQIMTTVPDPETSANEIYEALRKAYRGGVPVLQAMIWLAEQPWYAGLSFQPALHRNVISSVLLKGKAAASRAYLDQIAERAFDVVGLHLEPNPVIVIGHGAKRMADAGEADLAVRLEAHQAEVLSARETALADWLFTEWRALETTDRAEDWTASQAFRASWPLSRHLPGAPAAIATLMAKALARPEDRFLRAVGLAALTELFNKDRGIDPVELLGLTVEALLDSDLRLAEVGVDAALVLLEIAPAQIDVPALAKAFAACIANGGDAIEDAEELRAELEDALRG
ncbi:MAG: hypothetical protein AB3N23_19605 [Paracoccaceae bacterium]